MVTIATHRRDHKNEFDAIAEPFLQGEGLPFSSVLDAESIQRVFREEDGLFAQDDIFSTDITLWAFLAQALRDGKGASCAAAVADIATYMLQAGRQPPAGDTGDYCRARAKLSLAALRRLVVESARQLESDADESWLWNGLHAKLVDGFTFTMPDTLDNQEEFPQLRTQRPGAGFPIARCCTVVSLATACVCDMGIGPYEGKETGENALLRNMLDTFNESDVVVFDRYYCSFMMLAMLSLRGVQVCTRLHQRRTSDFRRGRRLATRIESTTSGRITRPAIRPRAKQIHHARDHSSTLKPIPCSGPINALTTPVQGGHGSGLQAGLQLPPLDRFAGQHSRTAVPGQPSGESSLARRGSPLH